METKDIVDWFDLLSRLLQECFNTVTVAWGPCFGMGNIECEFVWLHIMCMCVWARAGYEETSEQLTGYLFALTWIV